MQTNRVYEFGPFRLFAAELALLCHEKSVPLNNKALLTLLALVEEHGRVVTKGQLLDRVWKDTFVEEGVLSRNVCEVRKALRSGDKMQYIETLSKQGYRFVHQVSVRSDDSRPKQPISVAVLPFRVIGDDKNRYLGLGLADAVIARLGAIRKMVIRPTSAVTRYADAPMESVAAARELNVDAVLEGTVRLEKDHLRLIAHLVSAADNAPLWSNTFDCRFNDIFELEDKVAIQVATALVLRLSGAERERITRPSTRNAEAYRLYLQARYYFAFIDSHDLAAPLRYLEQALQHDPEFVECYASIANWYTAMTIHGSANPNEMVPKAKEAALKALRINRHQQQARAALAFAVWHYDYEWSEAETELRRMTRFAPNDPFPKHILAMLLAETHRTNEALREIELAQKLEPSTAVISSAGLVHWMTGRYEDAIERSRLALRIDPHCVRALWTMGMAHEELGKFTAAVRWLRKAVEDSRGASMMKASLAHVYAAAGRIEEARTSIVAMEEQAKTQYVPSAEIALPYIALGELDRAFELLFRSVGEHSVCLVLTDVDPRLKPLRSDPRFEQLRHAIGLSSSKAIAAQA